MIRKHIRVIYNKDRTEYIYLFILHSINYITINYLDYIGFPTNRW